MIFGQFSASAWLVVAQHELLLFAAAFFALGVADEIAVDLAWLWLRLSGRAPTGAIDDEASGTAPLTGHAAVFIPAWREAPVIGATIAHALAVWRYRDLTLYVGCYRNDPETIASTVAVARGDSRVRLVIVDSDGPTSKADCLNHLFGALCADEERRGAEVRMVVLHDAEDMVDPAALTVLDQAMDQADFVQLPVMALPQSNSRWIGSHYADEFAESHGKTMVVRSALCRAVPGAGVGCAVGRRMLGRLAEFSAGPGPFAAQSLTEDYELGLKIAALGGTGRFIRLRNGEGQLVATRAYFPSDVVAAVRQKTRWMHGIALQSWDRLGWSGSPVEKWMQLRDRRGPFAAGLLFIGYAMVISLAASAILDRLGYISLPPFSPLLRGLLMFSMTGLIWRAASRFAFTAREYGLREGALAVPRMMVSNIIAIMAGRRAIAAYLRSLRGVPVLWDKTDHSDHPAFSLPPEVRA